MILLLILTTALIIYSVRYQCAPFNAETYGEGFSKDNTTALRGLLALLILVYHLYLEAVNTIPLLELGALGNSTVAMFFFLSGYALIWSGMNKQDYFDSFIKTRVKAVFLPFIMYLVLYTVVVCCFLDGDFTEIIRSFYNGNPVSNSWYIIVIFVFYVFFYMCYRNVNFGNEKMIKRANFWLLFCTIGYVTAVIAWLIWIGYNPVVERSHWYISCVFFLIGSVFCSMRSKIERVLVRHYVLFFIGAIVVAASFYIGTILVVHFTGINLRIIFKVIAEICFVLLCVLMLEKASFSNRITAFLGKISLELYLCHGLITKILFGGGVQNFWIREAQCLLTVELSVLLAWILHSIFNKLFYKKRVDKTQTI